MAAQKRVEGDEMGGLKVSGGSAEDVYGDVIESGGGAYIYGDVRIEGDFIGRDQVVQTLYTGTQPAPLSGTGMLIWQLAKCEGGDIDAIAARAREAGFTHLFVKITDGARPYIKSEELLQLKSALAQETPEAPIALWGWGYVYGDDPKGEAQAAGKLIQEADLAGFVINAEREYKDPDKKEAAVIYLELLKDLLRTAPEAADGSPLPIGLASYRLPSYHPGFPWKVFLDKVDFVMPQVFWIQAQNPAAQLLRSYREYEELAPGIPYLPTGAAFAEGGWRPNPGEINEFLSSAADLRFSGANFFSWDYAGQPDNRDLWQAIAAFDWDAAWEDHAGISLEDVLSLEDLEVAFERQIPEPTMESRVIHIVHNDEVAGIRDRLGFQRYIDSFVQLILDQRTHPPLTIGISGAWGSGKSFLLWHIEEELQRRSTESVSSGKKSLGARLKWRQPRPLVHIVPFNAWEYNASEVVWAGLVRKIIETLEAQSGYVGRTLSRVRRNFRRQVSGVKSKLVPWIALLVAIVAVIAYLTRGDLQMMRNLVAGLGVAGALAIFQSFLNTPLTKWITDLFEGRQYGKFIGYMEEIRADITVLKNNLPEGTKIVVMIDDLDRCEHEKIVEVLEAIKLLLDFDIFIVFMGIDAAVIARAVEKRYEKILAEAGRSGYVYLDKIIQIPFHIPTPDPEAVNAYLFALLEATDPRSESHTAVAGQIEQLHKALEELIGRSARVRARPLSAISKMLCVSDPWSDLARYRFAAMQVRSAPSKTNTPQGFVELVWSLLANFWPVSAYLMHRQLHADLASGALDLEDAEGGEKPLAVLSARVQANLESDFRSTRLRELADSSQEIFKQFVDLNLPLTWEQLVEALAQRDQPYILNFAFTPAELEAFHLLSGYLLKNPRHIKRMINTYSLIRLLAGRTPDGHLVLKDPEATLKWLIINSQWPLTAQLMMDEFTASKQSLMPSEELPEDDSVLPDLLEKVQTVLAGNKTFTEERDRLDSSHVELEQLVQAGRPLSSKQLDMLRTYSINFNPALETLRES
jgi:hypothetical protein